MQSSTMKCLLLIQILFCASMAGCFGENSADKELDIVDEELDKLKNYNEVLIEQYIPGKEIQVAIMGKRKLGAIELVPKRKFYDYKAKYNKNANTKHIMPANISKDNYWRNTLR